MGGRIFNVDGVRNLDERNVNLLIQATEQIPSEA
jgi:hypothetical protein